MGQKVLDIGEIRDIYRQFGIVPVNIGDVIDTSHGEEDTRYNYILDDKYVLKMNTAQMVNESFLRDINCLVERYRDIGVWCPKVLPALEGGYIYEYTDRAVSVQEEDSEKEVLRYKCYIEEYAPYKIAEKCEIEEFAFKKKVLGHLGKLAAKYTNVELVEHRSMWSIIDLAPLDSEVDEKQENADDLCEFLRKWGYGEVAEELERANEEARWVIQKHFADLPRCVYQGDMNFSNLLTDDTLQFRGMIDFNMYGTEVNINCFLSETAWLEEADLDTCSAVEIYEKMRNGQDELLEEIFRYYTLNDVEKACFEAYRKLIFLFQYPHVMLWKATIWEREHADKVVELLQIILNRPCA